MGQALQKHQPVTDITPHPRRMGPRPLPLHLMTALCVWPSLPIVWPSLRNDWPSSNPPPPSLQKLRAAAKLTETSAAQTDFLTALNQEACNRTRRFISGIQAYQDHPDRRDVPEAPVIWQQGTTRLRDYNPSALHAPVILVIPSLINRFDILDLDLAPSFLRSLAAHGFRPLVVDWDTPGTDETNFGLTEYMTQRLIPVLEFIERSKAGVHLLGYCMGGLLALALAALKPQSIKTLTLMATPWDFHKPENAANSFSTWAEKMEPILQQMGQLPVDIIQSLFASLQPLQVLEKFSRFADMNPISMETRKFVLVEDWLNDGVPLTCNVARECIGGWYSNNVTAKGEWKIADQIIDPSQLAMPCYVIVPGKDKIVPPESALPLVKLLPHASLHEPMCGHIGLLAGRNAAQQIWAPLIHWLEQHA